MNVASQWAGSSRAARSAGKTAPRWPLVAILLLSVSANARASEFRAHPNGSDIARHLGPSAVRAYAPVSKRLTALVALPTGMQAEDLGLDPVSPGIARLRGDPSTLTDFAYRYPTLHLELPPPLRLLLDRAGKVTGAYAAHAKGSRGKGALVGIADTGIDVRHGDFRDPTTSSTRIAWLLDFSKKPIGKYPELERRFGTSQGLEPMGAVYGTQELNDLLTNLLDAPIDEIGHGSHVASLAAGNGNGGPYVGMAPEAELIVARIATADGEIVENDDVVRAVAFMFDRAESMGRPIAVNLSLGSDFGPHDGSMLWEQALASHVGPEKPGRALVAAAGNSGSIAEFRFHETVFVPSATRVRVPVVVAGAQRGGVQVWLTVQSGAKIQIGLDSPSEEWVAPIAPGENVGGTFGGTNAGVIYGSDAPGSPVPAGSIGAVVAWEGRVAAGTYSIVLEGEGLVDLYVQGTGDMGYTGVGFAGGVRQGTINLPGDHPGILAVGCSISRNKWRSVDGTTLGANAPTLAPSGMYPDPSGRSSLPLDGEVCWFSSAGPNALGVPKPEILAPGAAVIGAMSRYAKPGTSSSMFSDPECPRTGSAEASRCLQVDDTHAVAMGTSMSAPIVTGAIALLLSKDPTLTQERIVGLLQGGAHRWRSNPPFMDQAGPGELDVMGSLLALDESLVSANRSPQYSESWLTIGRDYADATGTLPLELILELRAEPGRVADGFDAQTLRITGRAVDQELFSVVPTRRSPGLWTARVHLPQGHGGAPLYLQASLHGALVAPAKSIPIATDPWNAHFATRTLGACSGASQPTPGRPLEIAGIVLVFAWLLVFRRLAAKVGRP